MYRIVLHVTYFTEYTTTIHKDFNSIPEANAVIEREAVAWIDDRYDLRMRSMDAGGKFAFEFSEKEDEKKRTAVEAVVEKMGVGGGGDGKNQD